MQEDKKLTIRDIQKKYGVTLMTVNNWRKGSKKREPIPCESEPRGSTGMKNGVVFLESKVTDWARRYNIREVK